MSSSILNSFIEFASAVKEMVNVKPVSTETTLQVGKRYLVLATTTLTLPDVTDRTSAASVHLQLAVGTEPELSTNPANPSTRIKVGAAEDSSVLLNAFRTIIVHYDPSSDRWII